MKKIILILCLFLITNKSSASHLMGGEITWECIKSGSNTGLYVFSLKVYRDCQGVQITTSTSLDVHNISSITSIPLNYISSYDLSPSCNTINGPNSQFSCGGSNVGSGGNGNGAVEEHIYRSDTLRIIGSPDSDGWHFTWTSCCRNSNITNGLADDGFTLRAVMYPYIDSLGVVYPNNNDCYDSSPKFYEKPRTILEVNNGYDPSSLTNGFTYSHNAFDIEQDSISYEWGQPIYGYDYLNPNSTALPFSSPYSYTSPINGIVLNSITGRTSYPADLQGNYVTCTKVSAFKCGQLVTEIYREIQIVLVAPTCNIGLNSSSCNVRPQVQPPFYYPGSPNPFQWDTIVHCGDTVAFDFTATDNDFYPDGTQQNLLFEVSGGQFYNYNDNIPCQNPPCATFVDSLSGATPPFTTPNGTGTGQFEWITSCNHVISSCSGYSPSVYTFVVRVSDDFCPAPAIENTAQVISITVYPPCNLKGNLTVTSSICGQNNGSIVFNPSGGLAPYNNYVFDMNGFAVNPDSLILGSYQIRITDASLCETIDTIVIAETNTMINNISYSNPNCYGSFDGAISVLTSGGIAPYNYLWNTGDTSTLLQNISAGQYIISVIDSNSCSLSDTILLIDPLAIFVSDSITDVSCFGFADGNISLNISGGTGAYSFLWNTGDTTQSLQNISSGQYSVIIIDNNNCIFNDTVDLIAPSAIQVIDSITNVSCFGSSNASVIFSLSGGTPGYIISAFGQTLPLLNPTSITIPSNIPIPAGVYPYSVTDFQGCILLDTIVVTQPSVLANSSSISYVTCSGFNNGSISINPTGGTGPYTYLWSNGDTTQVLINIPSGQYFVSILDSNNCFAIDTIMMIQPNQLNDSVIIISPTCFGSNDGNLSVIASGGTVPYNYLWNTGDTSSSIQNVSAGQYIVSVIDSNGCILYDTLNVSQPNAILVNDSINDVSCYGYSDGDISLSISGGTGAYALLWSNGDSLLYRNQLSSSWYNISIIDSNNCLYVDSFMVMQPAQLTNNSTLTSPTCFGYSNGSINNLSSGGVASYSYLWSTGDTTQNLQNIITGQYSVIITDFNNCIIYDTLLLDQPLLLSYNQTNDSVSCFGKNDGSIDLSINGGTVPYSFLWSTGDSSEDISNLYAGMYVVNILDSNNCLLIVNISVEEPDDLFAYFNLNYVSCFGLSDGNIDGTTLGGTPPYNYLWNSGDSTEDLTNIPSNMYILSLTDTNNCYFTDTVLVFEPDLLVADITFTSGSLISIGSGGTVPYTYEIYGPTGLFATTSNNMGVSFTINPLLTGVYTLVVTDANGCIDSAQVNVTPSSLINLESINNFNIYPNPSRDLFNLSFNSEVKQDIDISIYNILGEEIYNQFINGFIGKFSTKFNLVSFSKSVYILELKTDNLIINKKLILE